MRFAALVLVSGVACATASCGTVLGFEEAKDLQAVDAGDASTPVVDPEVTPAQGASGVVCVPTFPGEWRGPLAIFETSDGPEALLDCPSPYIKPLDVFGDLEGGPASCDCKCGAPTGATCSDPEVTIYSNSSDCSAAATPCAAAFVPPKTCTSNSYPPAATNCPGENSVAKLTKPAAPQGGGCSVTSGEVVPPARLKTSTRLCEPPPAVAGSCPTGKVATPATGAPYQTNYCVYVTGNAICPPLYPAQRRYNLSKKDTRKCECTCGAPTGVTCGGTVNGWNDTACSGGQKPVLTTCTGMGKSSVIRYTQTAPTGGSCAPRGGPTGELSAEDPVTVCCRR